MVRRVAVKAGQATLDHFDEAGYAFARGKADGSPVTAADHAAEEIIEKGLAALIPGVPLVAEEAVARGHIPDIEHAPHFWLADPLDGTKEFIAGRPDYTVNIALIRGDRPVLGVIYAPALGVLYAGCGPGTAIKWREEDNTEKPIRTRRAPAGGLTVLLSRSHTRRAEAAPFLSAHKVAKVLHRGSSLKMGLIAEGKADLYPRLGPTSEWDTAAAQAILEAAGGSLTCMDGAPMTYGHTGRGFLNPNFLAQGRDAGTK
jgi:3'(2'), 5'-bisphosphate nucleotidase